LTLHGIIGAGTEGSAMSKKKKRPHGHYCKICGEYKANEKFSGKGHAAHICKEDGERHLTMTFASTVAH